MSFPSNIALHLDPVLAECVDAKDSDRWHKHILVSYLDVPSELADKLVANDVRCLVASQVYLRVALRKKREEIDREEETAI